MYKWNVYNILLILYTIWIGGKFDNEHGKKIMSALYSTKEHNTQCKVYVNGLSGGDPRKIF